MTDIASLGIRVTTDGVKQADADLQKLQQTGKGAEESAAGVGKAWKGASAEVAASSAEISKSSATASASFTAIGASSEEANARIRAMVQSSLASQSQQAAAYQASAGAATKASAEQIAASKATIAAQTAQMQAYTLSRAPALELQAILSKTKLTTAEVAKAEALLDAAQASGVITTGELAESFAALDAAKIIDIKTTKAQIKANVEGAAAGKLNARTSRELGTILSEVATGRVGNARRSMGALANSTGLLAALFTPLGGIIAVAVGAVAAFGIAAIKASNETSAFNKAIILTGDYSGQTADSLANMAKSLSSFGTTQHAAAAALAEVAGSGKFTASQIALVGQAALDMSKLTGQSIGQTVKQFADLQDEPLKAVMKLDEAQHFLTTSIYEQIRALEEQGKTQDAADLASKAYAGHLAEVTAAVTQNLGGVESAWNSVKDSAKFAWDAMLDVDRPATVTDKIADIQTILLRYAKKGEAKFNVKSGHVGWEITDAGQASQNAAYLKSQLAEYKDLTAARDKGMAEANKKSIASQATLALEQSDAEAGLYATREQKRVKELAAAHKKANAQIEKELATGDRASAERIAKNLLVIQDGINAKYAEKTPKSRATGSKADPMASLNSLTDRAITQNSIGASGDAQSRILKEQVNQLQAIAKAGAEAISKGASLADVQAKVATATQTVTEHFKAESDQLRQKNVDAVNAYKASLDDMAATRQQQLDLQVKSIGMGAKEAQQQEQLLVINQRYNRKKAGLEKQQRNSTSAISNESYQQELDDLAKSHEDELKATKGHWILMDAAQASGVKGMNAALADFQDSAADVAGQSYRLFSNAFDGMADSITQFVTTGKGSFSDLAKSIIADLIKIQTRILLSQALTSLFGDPGGFSTDYANTGGNVAIGASAYANGGVFNSPSLSAYSNTIVDKPTYFARGGNVMGEAGPEAIIPLTRGPNGKLGVQAAGGGGMEVEINITNTGNDMQARQTGARSDGKKMMIDLILETVSSDMAGGGKTAKAAQQRFGLARRGVPVAG